MKAKAWSEFGRRFLRIFWERVELPSGATFYKRATKLHASCIDVSQNKNEQERMLTDEQLLQILDLEGEEAQQCGCIS